MQTPSGQAERNQLLILSQFILSRKSEKMRDELYEYLVKQTIYEHDKKGKGLKPYDIRKFLETDCGLTKTPIVLLDTATNNLVARGELVTAEYGFTLSPEKHSELDNTISSFADLRTDMVKEVFNSMKRKVGPIISQKEIEEVLFEFLGRVFYAYGILSADEITGTALKPVSIPLVAGLEASVQPILERVKGSTVRGVLRETLLDVMSNPTDHTRKFLSAMAQSYVIAEVLNLDPELRTMERKSFEGKSVYLDTNVIVSLLCTAHIAHNAVLGLIRLTNNLGVHIYYTSRTRDEFLALLAQSSRVYARHADEHETRILRKAGPLMEDTFIASYWKELEKTPALSWQGFEQRMENFSDILRNLHNVTLVEAEPHIERDALFNELSDAIRAYSPLKYSTTVERDATHMLLVREVRKRSPPDQLGVNFVVLDTGQLQVWGKDVLSST